jgi:hypothetical protein
VNILQTLEGSGVRFGKVDCDRWMGVCQRTGIRGYPSVRFYSGIESIADGQSQNPTGVEINSQQSQAIIDMVELLMRDRNDKIEKKKSADSTSTHHEEF